MTILKEANAAHTWNQLFLNRKFEESEFAAFFSMMRKKLNGFYVHDDVSKIPLRPIVLEQSIYDDASKIARCLTRLAEESTYIISNGRLGTLAKDFGIHPDASPLFSSHPLAKSAVVQFARPDFVIHNGELKFIELNIHTSIGGYSLGDLFPEIYFNSRAGREIRSTHSLYASNPLERIAQWISDLTLRLGIKHEPIIGIFEWEYDEDKLKWQAANLSAHGVHVIHVNPDHAELKDGYFYYNSQRIDIGIRGFSLPSLEFPKDTPLIKKFLEGHSAGGTLMLPCETASLASNKCVLAFMSENSHFFAPSDKKLIDTYVPWTRTLGSELKHPLWGSVSLADMTNEPLKSKLVLKKADGEQGSNVFIGRQTTHEVWLKALQSACHRERWIVQEYFEPDQVRLPFFFSEHNKIQFETAPVVFGAFVFGDDGNAGILTRANFSGSDLVVNYNRGATSGCAVAEADLLK